MWEKASQYISEHPYVLDLSRSRIKYPTSAYLENLSLEFTCNIRIAEDILSFDAVTNCSIALIEETEWNCGNSDIIQWLTISCEAKITDRLECLKITNICPYQRGYRKTAKGTFSSNIIPYIKKEDLEQEAEVFLKQYCPEALERPMCVPISAIAESMGLTIIQGRCLTDDFSIFGEICFSAGNVELFDLFKCSKSTVEVSRGTILIDAYTFWERNLGCVNTAEQLMVQAHAQASKRSSHFPVALIWIFKQPRKSCSWHRTPLTKATCIVPICSVLAGCQGTQ